MRRIGAPRLAVTLLTVLPVPGAAVPEVDADMAGAAMGWAPAVGLLLGVIAACVLYAGDYAGQLTGAGLAVAALALLTRGLHLDGLADLADGLGSGKPADEALAIMRRSDIGPMGVVTVVLTLLIQVAALAHAAGLSWQRGAATLIAAVVTGRLAVTWACRTGVPAARSSGLGALVAGTVRPGLAAVLTVITVIMAACLRGAVGWTLPAAVLAGLAAAYLLQRHAVRRLGGITGDVLGALSEVATTIALVVATVNR